MNFTSQIDNWYSKNKRDLPWRKNKDPYSVWLSEIILQQTKIQQGLPYYTKFIDKYPNVFSLASALEQDILKLWEGLGYYSRARNLHKTAKIVALDFGGIFPTTFLELLKLPGIGKYTASAISSICYEERQAVLDGNVFRLLSRYFNIDTPINSSIGIKSFEKLSYKLLPKFNIGDYNQGLMDFGSIICKPKLAKCDICILQDGCSAHAKNKIHLLPVKNKKNKVLTKHFNFLIFIYGGSKTKIEQRDDKGIWQKLYQFPLIVTDEELNITRLNKSPEILKMLPKSNYEVELVNSKPEIHNLSHRKLFIKYWKIKSDELSTNLTPIKNLENYPFPIVLSRFIKSYF
ncbi:A/G-specific adenine glycosylase [Flavobacteriaceae bacterium]|jgi:A/G-specific adenine glycosylase|nr:A/G-specific adenine glycosylase [Flavobacteriaceae bacterium]